MKDLKAFELWLEKVRNDEEEQLPFVWEIMRSPYVDYHYSLIKDKSLGKEFRSDLADRFDEHHEEGQRLLLSKLDNNEDIEFYADIIYMLGRLNDGKNRPDKAKVVDYAKKLALSPDSYTRNRAIIVLGWIGENSELPLLADRLLHDTNSKCRAWAASSFMQMSFRREAEGKQIDEKIVFPALRQAIADEQDYFALGTYIVALQEMAGKKWISASAAENIDIERIEKAKKSAINFINGWERNNTAKP